MKKGNIFQRIKNYLTEVKGELKKVTWPSKNDLQKTTIAVIILSIIFGIYLTLIDLSFQEVVKGIISIFR
ncbi:MAG: preprotein translocase subunit SecE [Candidatus Aminicenantes bacterium]|nr:preprotein translocase subunit SecE [Candidatus Aminicenantes bacterium]NIM79786.1 preprotein translocase subunit SecE [Candidatus Aminicenantes bacterium]NIN19114.1 preprotein translocase subunit SecE [Candidatus Aminicenantes bacterium]NIN43016.1 preprotein translocase subunit SecE [Candidatus Aminicenantes bacterium]NIN85759.1 preprotein translocase subunit SecE [Candidatus Aminicenantes bacterium]